MGRKLRTLLIIMLLAGSLFASIDSTTLIATAAEESHFSPLGSVSYSGRFYDYKANPAALPFVERQYSSFHLTMGVSENYSGLSFGEQMPGVENQAWDIDAVFMTRNMAFTGQVSSEFERLGSQATFDVYSTMHLQLDVAYSISHLSVGLRIAGGNSMVRREKEITEFTDLFVNAWFSPFQSNVGSDEFNLGFGAILDFGGFSAGVYIGKLMTTDDGELYIGWDVLSESTTIALSYEAGRYNKAGDLLFVRPRVSIAVSGLDERESRYLDVKGDLTFQFLPDADLTFAVSYLEGNYDLFSHDASNALVSFFLRGGYSHVYGELGLRFKADDWGKFAPSISITYIK